MGILVALLLILIAIVIVFKVRVPYGRSNSGFAIDWVDDVNSIRISEKDKTLLLEKSGNDWEVNGLFIARKSAIDFILKAIASVEIKSPVSDDLYSELVEVKHIEPLRVQITGRKKANNYLIYKNPDSPYGSIFRKSLKSKPFFVTLPAYDIDPGYNFVTDSKFWMPYYIFNLKPDIISSVELIYKDPGMNDILIVTGNKENSLFINGSPSVDAKQDKIRRYITYFTFIPFETWAIDSDKETVAKIINSEPEIIIKVGLSDGNKVVARFWTRLIDTPGGPAPDTDRLYGALDGGSDVFIARFFDIDPLIKSAEYFISD